MRRSLLLLLAACASAPSPKAPDESHRVRVNKVPPPEVAPGDPPEKSARRVRSDGGVEWR